MGDAGRDRLAALRTRPGSSSQRPRSAQGLERGTIIILDRIGTELEVVGLTDGQATFCHVDVAYLPLGTWQLIAAGQAPEDGRPTADQVGAVDVDQACVVALQPSTARTWR